MSIPFTLQWYCEVEQQDIGYQDLFKVVRYHCSVTDITITAVWSKTETKIEPHRFHWFKCIPVYLGPDFFSCRIAPQESNKQIQNNWHLQTESNRSQFLFLPCHNWGAWNHVWLHSFYYRVLNPSHRKCHIYVFISPQYVWEDLHLTPVSGWRGPFLPCDGRSPHAPLPPPGWWKHHRTASPQ